MITNYLLSISKNFYIVKISVWLSFFSIFFVPIILQAKPKVFHFANYNQIKSKKSFLIYAIKKKSQIQKIGNGKIHLINSKNLTLSFRVSTSLYTISGNVRLKYIKRTKKSYLFKLQYQGVDNGFSKTITQIVYADKFLANNGIFVIHFSNNKRFLQMSINSKGQNRLITEWGSAILR